MIEKQVRFRGPEYDGAEESLGTLTTRLPQIAIRAMNRQRGIEPQQSNRLNQAPTVRGFTDFEITPVVVVDEKILVITAWNETIGRATDTTSQLGSIGVFQRFSASFEIVTDTEEAYLQDRADAEIAYPLSTVETLTLANLLRHAEENDRIHSPLDTR